MSSQLAWKSVRLSDVPGEYLSWGTNPNFVCKYRLGETTTPLAFTGGLFAWATEGKAHYWSFSDEGYQKNGLTASDEPFRYTVLLCEVEGAIRVPAGDLCTWGWPNKELWRSFRWNRPDFEHSPRDPIICQRIRPVQLVPHKEV